MGKKLNNMQHAYTKFLHAINVRVEDDGTLVQTVNDVDDIVYVDDKPLLAPIDSVVKDYTENMVVFHPLSENILLGESPVLQKTRLLVLNAINSLVMKTVETLIMVSLDNELVSKLTPNQVELLRGTAGTDANSLKNWQSIMRRIDIESNPNRPVTIFLKRGVNLNGEDYKRAAIVNFGLYSILQEGEATIYGTKIRKADVKVYSAILESLFENIGEADEYSVGSNSGQAPYFDALVKAYAGLVKQVNKTTWNLRKAINTVTGKDLHVKDDFAELLSDLSDYQDALPAMPLNDGDRNASKRVELSKPTEETKPVVEQPQPVVPQVQPQVQPQTQGVEPITQTTPNTGYQQPATPALFVTPQVQQPVAPVQQPTMSISEQIRYNLMGGQVTNQVFPPPTQPIFGGQPAIFPFGQVVPQQQPSAFAANLINNLSQPRNPFGNFGR